MPKNLREGYICLEDQLPVSNGYVVNNHGWFVNPQFLGFGTPSKCPNSAEINGGGMILQVGNGHPTFNSRVVDLALNPSQSLETNILIHRYHLWLCFRKYILGGSSQLVSS